MKLAISPIVLLFVILASGVQAQPHLVPVTTHLGGFLYEYHSILSDVFRHDGRSNDVLTRMILTPKHGRESLSGIMRVEDGYVAYSVVPDESIWRTGWQPEPTANRQRWIAPAAQQINVQRHTVPIDSVTAHLLHDIWKRAILEVRYPDATAICTGGSATFATWVMGRGVISGKASCSFPDSPAWALQHLGVLVGRYARDEAFTLEEIQAIDEMQPSEPGLLTECYSRGEAPLIEEIQVCGNALLDLLEN